MESYSVFNLFGWNKGGWIVADTKYEYSKGPISPFGKLIQLQTPFTLALMSQEKEQY